MSPTKYSVCGLLILIAVSLFGGEDRRSFEHFKAPNVVGAYNATWNPLGPTLGGFNFEVGFYLADGGESNPTRYWISKKNDEMIEVASISAVNRVITDINASESISVLSSIDVACKMLRVHVSAFGPSGLPLDEAPRRLTGMVSRLSALGLDGATADLLLSLGREASRSVNQAGHTWTATWYEIDKLGSIERVFLSGSTEPFKVVSILREGVQSAGTVPPELLRRENFYDLSEG